MSRFRSRRRLKMRRCRPRSPCTRWQRRSADNAHNPSKNMATSVVMPALEMAQETGKIVSWLKKEGDAVSKGEILLEVEAQKAGVEVEATADAVLAGVKSREGDVVPVGQTIAWLVSPGEQPPAEPLAAPPAARAAVGALYERPGRSQTAPTEQSEGSHSPQISPKARRLAKEKGVDITKIVGR